METRKAEKVAALATAAVVLAVSLLPLRDIAAWGIRPHCTLVNRLTYHFIHANIFHAVLNAWCFVAVVFVYRITRWHLLAAYVIASSVPCGLLAHISSFTPTVGLSGIVFALFGSVSFQVKRRLYWQSWMLAYLLIGLAIPNCNAFLHIWCYALGLGVALLNKPIAVCRR
jgi:membrane associated rhomboid family serine protease